MAKQSYLIIGGCGFLGKHIIRLLFERDANAQVSVLDLVFRDGLDTRVKFYSGDITDLVKVKEVFSKASPTTIIHTASPVHGLQPPIYHHVNVTGTSNIIAACQSTPSILHLIYTSSAGVVFHGPDLVDIDERMPFPDTPMDAYNETKSIAETLVLEANDNTSPTGLKTLALRPAGIFGEGDRQLLTHVSHIGETNRAKFQLGDNLNLFDWTYVENVAWAHIVAADRLREISSQGEKGNGGVLEKDEADRSDPPLLPVGLTTGSSLHRIPTSLAKPLGPAVNPTAEDIAAAHAYKHSPWPEPRPIVRNKYDQFSPSALDTFASTSEKDYPLQIAGQAFFITNAEPIFFWDFMRALWEGMGYKIANDPRKRIVFPKPVAMALALASEVVGWVVRKEMTFTRFRVALSCASRWYNVEKARRVLGYEPRVGIEEGVRRTVKWWNEEGSKMPAPKAH